MAGDYSDMESFPNEWPLLRVGDFAAVKGGKRLPLGTALVQNRTSHPYLRIVDFKDGRIDKSNLMYVPEDVFPRIARYTISSKDIYVSIVGTIGLVGIVDEELDGANLTENAAKICNIAPHVDQNYLAAFLRSGWGQHQIGALTVGSTQPKLALFRIEDIRVPVPSLAEQRAIAHILGTLDDKIELNRRMNETLEAMARALFKSWFVDFDPVRAKAASRPSLARGPRLDPIGEAERRAGQDAPMSDERHGRRDSRPTDPGLPKSLADLFPDAFEDSELGEIPKGWQCSTIGKHFKLTMGQSPPGSTYNESGDGLPFFQGRTDFGFRFPSLRVFCTAPTRLAEVGDTLVSVRAPVGDVNIAIEPCAVGRGVAAVRHLSGSRSFTYHAMHNLGEHFDKFEGEGTVFGSINKADFERLPFVVPPQAVLDCFERIASPIDDRVESNEGESRTLTALRDTLLPKLISGELRVSEGAAKLRGYA